MRRIFTHLLFWTIILFWTSAIYDYNGKFGWVFIQFNLVRLPLMMAATYLVIYDFVPRWLIRQKNYLYFSLAFILNFIVTTLLDRVIISSSLIHDILSDTGLVFRFFNDIPILRNSFVLLSIMGLAALIRFFKLYLQQERSKHELQEEQLATELAFLKAQINPHFLFNALNNLYSMAIQKERDDIAAGLENLSGVMQYLTYESSADKIALEKEIQLVQNYLDIQQLRIAEADDATISFNIEGQPDGRLISPVILLPLVENAFKHGLRPEQRCLVHIHLLIKGGHLDFIIKNTFFTEKTSTLKQAGIGLSNVRKRLQLIYPGQHQLTIERLEKFFITRLRIDLPTMT